MKGDLEFHKGKIKPIIKKKNLVAWSLLQKF